MPLSEAQKRAQKKYNESHKNHRRYLSYRNTTRTFLRNYATNEDLDELTHMVTERRQVNDIMSNLDAVRGLINEPDFEMKSHAHVTIWRRPTEMLEHHLSTAGVDKAAVQDWFNKTGATQFDAEMPIVEIDYRGQTYVYDALHAYDIVEWLLKSGADLPQ
ncbi:MAG TPA: hypothetical protein DCW31_10010 [Lactobacillus sp.]|nr:hypothetical protein [Lactobacillus sp.]